MNSHPIAAAEAVLLVILPFFCGVLLCHRHKDAKTRWLAVAMATLFVSLGAELLTWLVRDGGWFQYVANYTAYLSRPFIIVFFGYYGANLIREKAPFPMWPAHAITILSAISIVLMIAGGFAGKLFTIQGGEDVVYGPFALIPATFALLVCVWLAFIVACYGRRIGPFDTIALLACVVFPGIGGFIDACLTEADVGYCFLGVGLAAAINLLMLYSGQEERDHLEKVNLKLKLSEAHATEFANCVFLATMSHEIRTPLNAVVSFAEFLRAPDLTYAERLDYLNGIQTSSKALLALINDILDLSKLEAGKLEMFGGRCNLPDLFKEMAVLFRFRFNEKGLRLRLDLDAGLPVIDLKEERLRQILINLIGNAVKFTEIGQVTVTAETNKTDAGEELLISVTDTGIGIAPDRLESIFDPFSQGSGVRGGKVYEGTGLGLTISRRLIEAAGGTLVATSTPGEGSTFTLRLPGIRRLSVRTGSTSEADSAQDPNLRTRDVYYVDDVPLNLKVLGIHLKNAGLDARHLQAFSDPAALLEALREKNKYLTGDTLVLTDMWMPEMSGEELARALRADGRTKGARIVAVTADADTRSSFDVSLFDDIIVKPLTSEKIRNLLTA